MVEHFKIHAQRHVYPLFIKDELGGYDFSSTLTFVKRKNEFFCIFAAHAIPKNENTLNNIGCLKVDGEFISLEDIAKFYKIYRSYDLVICCTKAPVDQKNYFDLDVEKSTTEFNEDAVAWVGFPKKKAKRKYHQTKASTEHVKQDVSTFEDGRLKWTNANYLLLGMLVINKSDVDIVAHFDDMNVTYEKEGFKEQAYSLKGMSGGALFHGPLKINTEKPMLSDFFKFAGIGLEHHASDKIVKGASAGLIADLIDQYLHST